MKITKGKQQRAQRVVIYGVESVGKSTFAAQFPKPLFLDVEGGTAHLDTDRSEIDDAAALESAIRECQTASYDTIIIDSIDWTERMLVDQLLAEHKKKSVEDFGYGKGYVMAAEKMARLLSQLDLLIDAGKNVVLIAHAQVRRAEPPDLMAAYDRYELKLEKKASPLVKEWADELWFFKFKTKTVESESGRSKGIGGKERIILTTHSAAYDAKTRSGLAEELPMAWESVAHLFAKPQPKIDAAVIKDVPAWQFEIERSRDDVDGFLRSKGMIKADESWRHAGDKALARIEADPAAFLAKVREWKGEA
jgi:GTPase SAR1 family protein